MLKRDRLAAFFWSVNNAFFFQRPSSSRNIQMLLDFMLHNYLMLAVVVNCKGY